MRTPKVTVEKSDGKTATVAATFLSRPIHIGEPDAWILDPAGVKVELWEPPEGQ